MRWLALSLSGLISVAGLFTGCDDGGTTAPPTPTVDAAVGVVPPDAARPDDARFRTAGRAKLQAGNKRGELIEPEGLLQDHPMGRAAPPAYPPEQPPQPIGLDPHQLAQG